MSSLQEQLLKAGLTNKKKARQATLDKKKQHKQQRHNQKHNIESEDLLKKEIEQAKAQKLAQDREMAAKQKAELEAREEQARIRQLLEHHSIKHYEGEVGYNFTWQSRVKRLDVTDQIQRSLVKGTLAICSLDERFYIVPQVVAAKIATLQPEVIALLNEKVEQTVQDEEDPYADFQIPDDLMW